MFRETRRIKWEYEDNLNFDSTFEMYLVSKIVDGVRMYPYIEVGMGRYYLESNIEDVNIKECLRC